MQVIYKYELNEYMPVCEVLAPIIAPLRVDYQNGKPFLWAVVDTSQPDRLVRIHRVGTGFVLPGSVSISDHLNTTVQQSEPYVWHWFCEIR